MAAPQDEYTTLQQRLFNQGVNPERVVGIIQLNRLLNNIGRESMTMEQLNENIQNVNRIIQQLNQTNATNLPNTQGGRNRRQTKKSRRFPYSKSRSRRH